MRAWRMTAEGAAAMMAALVIGGLLLAGMACVTGYAARALPAAARVPLNAGVPERSVWLSRRAGLAAWLGAGAVAYAALAALTASGTAANWSPSVRAVLLPAVMLILLAAQSGAIITARRKAPPPPDAPATHDHPVSHS
jgi:hypothetical protein